MSSALVLVAVGVAALGCLILLGEMLLRVRGKASTLRYVWDPDVGLLLEPTQRARWVQAEFCTDIVVNRHGWHDREHSYAKPPGVRRILLVGDSFIEAVQVPHAATVHRMLEDLLNGSRTPQRYEVIGMGLPGTGTTTENVLIRKFGLAYSPDVVILNFFTLNDVSDNLFALARHPGRPYFKVNDGSLVLERAPQLRRGQRLTIGLRLQRLGIYHAMWTHVLGRFYGRPDLGSAFAVFSDSLPGYELAWVVTEATLRNVDKIVRAAGARFLVTVTPPKEAIYQDELRALRVAFPGVPFDMEAVDKRLATVLSRAGIDYHLLASDLRAASRRLGERLYWSCDGHWTAAGHREAAVSIARKLWGGGYLEAPVARNES